jgi:hypothetical protein
MELEEARQLTRQARTMGRKGEDPKADDIAKSDSFEASVEAYIKHEQIGRHGNKSALATQRVMLHNGAAWVSRPVATIRYQEIDRLLTKIRDGDGETRPRPPTANRLYAHLKDFFSWAVRSKLIKESPMTGMQTPSGRIESRNRDWFKKSAADDAIRSLWSAADQIAGSEGRFIKLMILTGKRISALKEIMRWEQIDSDFYWDAPESLVKNKRLHGIPLPMLAQRLLSPRQAQGKVFTLASTQRLQTKIKQLTGLDDFFWHGIRHLVETKCAELRDDQGKPAIPPHIRDLLFDHAWKRGAGAGYDHHDYKGEMRDALEAWAAHVEQTVRPEGVALLR